MGKYSKDHLESILNMDDPNEHEDQRVRQRNAWKCVIVSLNKEAQVAEFKSSGRKNYVTTPDSCSCQDFALRLLPCKHMYRLMHELGKFDLGSTPDGKDTVYTGTASYDDKQRRALIKDMVKKLKKDQSQLVFSLWNYRIGYMKGKFIRLCADGMVILPCELEDVADSLIDVGFWERKWNYEGLGYSVDKKEFVDFLRKNIDGFVLRKETTHEMLVEYAKEREIDLSTLWEGMIYYTFSDIIMKEVNHPTCQMSRIINRNLASVEID